MPKKMLFGLAGTMVFILALIGIFSSIFQDELNVWFRESWQQNPWLVMVAVGAIVCITMVIAFVTEALKDQPAAPPPAASETPRHIVQLKASTLSKTDPQLGNFVAAARQEEIKELQRILTEAPSWWQRYRPFRRRNPHQYGPVAVVTGIGGIGKTSLARYVAYRQQIQTTYRHRLYLNMNGLYQPQSSDEEALRTVLRESGLYAEEQLQALNRDQLRGQYQQYMEQHPQTLLLIDDPADNTPLAALRPLPGCGLVIIARPGGALRQSLPGHRLVQLAPLDKIQAHKVLKQYWTEHFDAAVADQICALCGYVPLALVVAGGTIQSEQRDDPQPARVAQRFADKLAAEAGKRPGLVSQFFQKFTAGGQAEENRKDIQTVLSLSYNLLTEPAQQLFRALPTFGRLPFTAPAALAVAALDPAEQDSAFNQLRERGLIRKVESDTESHQEYYQMYDLLYEYARHEQSRPAHQQEMRPCLERYLDYYIQYVADCSAAFQPGSLTALSQFAAEAAHISTCFATLLDEPLTDADGQLLLPDNAVRGLKLVAPALPLLQAGLQVPELAQDENTLLFKPDTYAHWQAAGQQAVRQVYAELSAQRQQQATIMRMFVDWFDAAAARQIAQASQDDLDELIRIDYLQQRSTDQRYGIRWQLVADFLHKQVDDLPLDRRTEVHTAYATCYADRAKEYRQQLSLFAQDIAHIRHGQELAAHASPPLDTALIAYARWSFWYFDQQREYSTLAD